MSTPELPAPMTSTRLPLSWLTDAVLRGMDQLAGERAGIGGHARMPGKAGRGDDRVILLVVLPSEKDTDHLPSCFAACVTEVPKRMLRRKS